MSIYLSICLSICLSVYLSICLSVCVSVCLPLCTFQPIIQSIYIYLCLYLYLYLYLPIYRSIFYLFSICQSINLSINQPAIYLYLSKMQHPRVMPVSRNIALLKICLCSRQRLGFGEETPGSIPIFGILSPCCAKSHDRRGAFCNCPHQNP